MVVSISLEYKVLMNLKLTQHRAKRGRGALATLYVWTTVNTYNASENKKKQQQKYNNGYKRNLVKMDLIGDDCMMREILKRLICSSVFFWKMSER